ncbi:MAG: RNase adapter RapZ [Oscillospiraceae bacterium]|nr:RNase adapter RapZ [Oscillospiraceae bacterium]
MTFLIVTGLSGSGKSSCIKVLEDIGFFCIDNMPPQLIPNFAELCAQSSLKEDELEKVAIVTDIRGGTLFLRLSENISKLRGIDGADVKILFLDCAKEVLMKRYSETRRKHPLDEASEGDLSKAIDAENALLTDIRANSDYIIDSSLLTARQLQEQVAGLFLDKPSDRMIINCMSFGFMYGVPGEADLVFDVRCLPNPFYIPELKHLTGTDRAVRDYVMGFPQSAELEKKLYDFVDFLAPLYVGEGKSRLVVAFGCTGGKHRSVTFAELAAKHFEQAGYRVRLNHRDKDK